MRTPNYDKHPAIPVPAAYASDYWQGWTQIAERLRQALAASVLSSRPRVIALECYSGVFDETICQSLATHLTDSRVFSTRKAFKTAAEIDRMLVPYLGEDDPVFGYLCTDLQMSDFLHEGLSAILREAVLQAASSQAVLLVGPGASLLCPKDSLIVYADMPRWEGQLRQRRNEVSNLGADNHSLKASLKYKRSFFVDWRVCDRLKQRTLPNWDFLLDSTDALNPKLTTGAAHLATLAHAVTRPFRVVPFFDPGVWGGQWMKNVCDLDRSAPNYAWCFDCVPEENSLFIEFAAGARLEIPSLNLVLSHPRELLGDPIVKRFGAEFPIRFDFLDTMGGGNLSFQVHPPADYARAQFGLSYTQDESYYVLDAQPGATVYLGCKDGTQPEEFFADLKAARRGEKLFDDTRFAGRFPAKKHDHFLIPAGTLHCSGAGTMVLEISATPYIFTFKLWDWARLGMDGVPRPVHLDHGRRSIRWDRDESYARQHLVNQITPLAHGNGWREERTGLHEAEFIETRRHHFTGQVPHDTGGTLQGGVNVLNLVEGETAMVESPGGSFEPFIIHYAETFIVPACVGEYRIRPLDSHAEHITVKAFVRP